MMAGGGATLQLLATLQRWPGALQLAALLRRWPTTHCSLQRSSGTIAATRWMSQRCCDGQQRVGCRNVAAMADSALDLATCCYDVWQRVGPRSVAAMSDSTTTTFLFFFFTRQLEERKRMGEREKF